MSASLTSLAYLVAAVLFILALRGLSSPGHVAPGQPLRHDRHGGRHRRHARPSRHERLGYGLIVLGIIIGGAIGTFIALRSR